VAYATVEDVQAEAPQLRLTDASRPTLDEARRLVAQVDSYVNTVVRGLGYATPVTGPQSLILLRDIVVQGSIAKILKAMFYGIKNPDDVGANEAWRDFTTKLKRLQDSDDPFVLPDAVMNVTTEKLQAELDSDRLSLGASYENETFWPTRSQEF